MQSFFNNKDEERELKHLTDVVYDTLIKTFKYKSPYLSIPEDVKDSLKDTVYKLIKIISQQNQLLLQFPAILAYFVYNFLKNIDFDRLNYINEKLDDIMRLIQRKNLQGLSFNTIKQILQQELQEKKFRRNRPSRGEKQQEEQKQSGKGGEKQQQEGQKTEEEESHVQQEQELGEESQESNGQENVEEQGQQESSEEGEGQESEGEAEEGQQGVEEGQENEGEQQSGEEKQGEELGEEEGQNANQEGEQESEGEEQEGEGTQEEGEEGESYEGIGESGEQQGEEEGSEQGENEGEEGGEESQSGQEGEGEEGEEAEGEGSEQGENEGEQEGQTGEEGQENEGEQQSGEESGEGQNGEEGEEVGESGEQQGEEEGSEQGENEGEEGGEESQSGQEGEGEEAEGESENEGQNGGQGEGQESESEESQGEGNEQENEEQSETEASEGEQGGEGSQGEEGGESEEQELGEEQEGEGEGSYGSGEQQSGEEANEGEQGGEGGGQQNESNQGQNNEQESEGGEGQEIEDIFEELERDVEEESMILDQLEESLQKSMSALSIGRGSGGGILNKVDPRILELLERANRILALANQVDLEYANRGVKDQGGVMKGITIGNNIKQMFRSQLILPDEIFLERYVNRALLQRAVENEGVGDFYFIIDKSGSMGSQMPNGYTALENVSAVALASAMEAEKNNRKVFVQYFDDSTTEPLDVNNVFEIAQTYPGGGTDMMVALKRFMDYYNNYPGLKDVKQIFILSDFETPYDNTTLEEFKNFAKNNGIIITCLHVYGDDKVPDEMQSMIDELCDEYYKFNNYDASELFSVVYSKV